VIDRTKFKHWGRLPDLSDTGAFRDWLKGARAFVAEFHRVLGMDCSPKIVFEHPGMATLPTSIFICDNGGMVVTCAGTTGYNADVDLRYLWMRQKRFQGSHFANTNQCRQFNEMICSKRIDPALSEVFTFDQIGQCHQMMFENRHPPGNMAVLVNAHDRDEGRSA
jgi:crotonyl-CoA carboxylase/reductase